MCLYCSGLHMSTYHRQLQEKKIYSTTVHPVYFWQELHKNESVYFNLFIRGGKTPALIMKAINEKCLVETDPCKHSPGVGLAID